jgi:hypothetical protein
MKNNDKHKFTPEQLGAYYDGQLGESERHEIEWHAKTCPHCQAFLADLALMDKAVTKAECVSAPDGYFQTFGSAVANRIARQKLAPRKLAQRFSWGWVTAAAALASLAIVLVSGDLNKPLVHHSAPKEPITILSENIVEQRTRDEVPAEKSKVLQVSPGSNQAEVPAEKAAGAEAQARPAETTEAAPEAVLPDNSLDRETPAAAPAKRAKDMEVSRESKAEMAEVSSGAGLAPAPAQAPDKRPALPQIQVPAPAPAAAPAKTLGSSLPALTVLEHRPAKVENVTVIVICLPDGQKDCPEPKATSAIRISLGGN